jgi:uncharacterized metal-binding protein YceD (DUF177 family)
VSVLPCRHAAVSHKYLRWQILTICKPSDVDLSNIQVKQFFQQATEVEHKTLQDHYNYAPCAIEGTLTYQRQRCNWQVRAGATGYVQCAGEYHYFACDNCEQLFNPTTQK